MNHADHLDDQDLARTLLDLNADGAAGNGTATQKPSITRGTYTRGASPRVGADFQATDLPTPGPKAQTNGHSS